MSIYTSGVRQFSLAVSGYVVTREDPLLEKHTDTWRVQNYSICKSESMQPYTPNWLA
jgi:hypothetical protein